MNLPGVLFSVRPGAEIRLASPDFDATVPIGEKSHPIGWLFTDEDRQMLMPIRPALRMGWVSPGPPSAAIPGSIPAYAPLDTIFRVESHWPRPYR